jgi:hypothetical protein
MRLVDDEVSFLLILVRINSFFVNLEESLINDTLYTTICEDNTIKCTPRKGDWAGGDDVLMTIPKLNKRKGD